jgi:hypothetical protein
VRKNPLHLPGLDSWKAILPVAHANRLISSHPSKAIHPPSQSIHIRFFNLSEPGISESQTHPNHQEIPPEFSRRPSLFHPPPALTPNRFPRHPPNERTFSLP